MPTITRDDYTLTQQGLRSFVTIRHGEHVQTASWDGNKLTLFVPGWAPQPTLDKLAHGLRQHETVHNHTHLDQYVWDTAGIWTGAIDDGIQHSPESERFMYDPKDQVYAYVEGAWRRAIVVKVNRVTVQVLCRDLNRGTCKILNRKLKHLRTAPFQERYGFPIKGTYRTQLAQVNRDGFTARIYSGDYVLILEDATRNKWRGHLPHRILTVPESDGLRLPDDLVKAIGYDLDKLLRG